MNVKCDYCGERAQLWSGERLYPHRTDLRKVKAWVCEPCDARVGCHPGTDKPLGRLANESLRKAKMEAAVDLPILDGLMADPPLTKSGESVGRFSQREIGCLASFLYSLPERQRSD